MKLYDPEANKKLEKERLAKALYCKGKLVEVKKESETTKEISSFRSTFSHTAIKGRSLKNAAAAPSSSPSKKVGIVESLTNQFNLKVQYSNQNKVGRQSNALTEAETDWLMNFLIDPT